MSLTLGVLSWGAHNTLYNTLKSYENSGLLVLADQKIIFFQEKSSKDIVIAKDFGFEAIGSTTNLGIAAGYTSLIASAIQTNFLFLENDWECTGTASDVAVQIGTAQGMLESGVIDLARLRSRTRPGNPLWTRQFEGREYDRPTHLLDCVHWEEHPEKFKEITEILPRVYVTTSKNANWTNNPHIAKTEFLLNNITERQLKGDLELDIQPWWERQDFKVMQSDGLFTHNRID